MRWKQLTRHVWGGYVYWPLPVMVWIVEDRDGLTLVDAGIPSMWNSLYQALNVRFKNKPLVRVLLTHSHGDHVGMLPNLTRTLQVPIVVHPLEVDRISEIASNPIISLDLDYTYGGLIPYHTPGHSPGHVVFYHPDDQILLAGDLFTAFFGKLRRPIAKFTPDMEESLRSGKILERLDPKLTACAHCGVVKHASSQYPKLLRRGHGSR